MTMNNTQQKLEWSHPHANSMTPQVLATPYLRRKTFLKRRCEAEGRGNLNPAERKSVCSFEWVIDSSLRSRRLLRFARKDGRLSRRCEAEGRGNLKTVTRRDCCDKSGSNLSG